MTRILIVEDSRTQAAELYFVLEEAGFEVDVATSGEEALVRFADLRYDLVISDIVMPGMSGYELCRTLKARTDGACVPVVLLSSLGDPMDIVAGLECGADNFVTKPYDPALLVRRVQGVLDNRAVRQQAPDGSVEVSFLGQRFVIGSEKEQILDLLLSTFEDIVHTNRRLQASEAQLSVAKQRIEAHAQELERQVRVRTHDLEEQKRHLAEAQSIARLGNWRLERDSAIAEWSDEVFRIFQLPPAGHVRLDEALARVHPDDRPGVERGLEAGFASDEPRRLEFRIFRPDGGVRHCWAKVRSERDASGVVAALFGIFQDITDLKLAEITARENAERYRGLVDTLPDGVFLVCGDELLFANEPAKRLLGDAFCDAVGDPADAVSAGGALGDTPRALAALPPGLLHSQRLQRSDGSEVEAEILTSIVQYKGVPAVQVLVRDVTERNELARQMQQAQRLDAVGQLTGGMAHDFNNLLAIIMGNSEMLREEIDGDPAKLELVDEVLGATRRGSELVRRLLAFARKQQLQPKVVDLNDRLSDTVALLQRTLGEHIRIETRLAGGLWPALVDPAQADDAILNLAINARDAMPGGGTLIIETANMQLDGERATADIGAGDYVMVAVTDTGTGMPPEVVARALEPFFTTKEPGRGTGLGLSQVYGLIKQSNGHLDIESTPGEGTTIRLFLPRIAEARPTRPVPAAGDDLSRGTETVLVVEDNPNVRRLVVRQLGELGYAVVEAEDAHDALARLEAGAVNLLFTDVVMPGGMSGYELAAQARKRWPHLKLLLTSGFARGEDQEHADEQDGRPPLAKPYTRKELAQAVRSVLDET